MFFRLRSKLLELFNHRRYSWYYFWDDPCYEPSLIFKWRLGLCRFLTRVTKRIFGSPRIFYLAPNGDDAADGKTWATRKRTIRAMEKVVKSGDTVYCGGPSLTA